MANKKILIQLSDENTEFFSDLLARDDIEIVSEAQDTDTDYMLVSREEYEHLYNQIRELVEEKEFFAHELKNPLAEVKGYSDVLLSGMAGDITEQQEKFLHEIKSSANQIQMMIEDMRDPNKISAGVPYEPQNKLFSVREQITICMNKLSEQYTILSEISIKYINNFPLAYGDTDYFVRAFKSLLKYVLNQPFNNRIPKIIVKQVGAYVRISIAPFETNTDFEIFSKELEFDERTPEQNWLVNAKYATSENKGLVWEKADPNKGSTLHFTTPIAKEEVADD